MNKKKITYLFLMMSVALMTSCLKNQDDVFDKSASIRSIEYLNNARKVLTSAENGWVMNYYPSSSKAYGGFSYVLKFNETEVTTFFVNGKTETRQLTDGTVAEVPLPDTTTYSLTNEDGPCIAFDTYSDYLHYYATPSAGAYEAKGGDFIFIILNISDDQNTITLKGNRSGNLVRLYRNTISPEQYITECMNVTKAQLYETFVKDDVQLELDLDGQQATVSVGEESKETAFIITNKGIQLYEPVTIGGNTFESFIYNAANNTYIPENDQSLVLTGSLPAGWRSYEDLAGKYRVGASTITVKTNPDGKTYSITGFVNNVSGTITASYKYTKGSFVLWPQYAGMYADSYYIWLLAYGDDGLSWDEDILFKGKNSSTTPLTITFSASGWSTIWAGAFEGETPSGDSYAGYMQQYSEPLVFERID
jgi:hypothetical protein